MSTSTTSTTSASAPAVDVAARRRDLETERDHHSSRLDALDPSDPLVEGHRTALAAIDVALARIEDGTYGCCRDCGTPIPDERLAAVPEAVVCVDCLQRPRALFR